MPDDTDDSTGPVELYHEVHGELRAGTVPLLLIHGGGSTIDTTFAALLPLLAATRRVVAVELQGHGRSPDPGRRASFESSARDLEALLDRLGLDQVDVLGFSNGGTVGLRLAAARPELVRRQILASTPYRRDGMVDGFWEGLAGATLASMPVVYLDADRALNPEPAHQQRLFDLDRDQMLALPDIPAEELAAMTTPTLLVVADRDVVRVEHVAEMARLVPGARLLVLPGTHGDYLGEVLAAAGDLMPMRATLPWLLRFLDEPDPAGKA